VDLENVYEKSLKDPAVMTVTWELVPGRGAREKAQETVILEAEKAVRGGKISAISLTDSPGGFPALMAALPCEGNQRWELYRLSILPQGQKPLSD
jgi:methylenetetrahydrofolate reductase (NADPH)